MADPRVDELQRLLPQCLLADWVRLGARLVRLLRDRHHAGTHDAILDRLLAQAQSSAAHLELRRARVPIPTYPGNLPISARKDDIVAAIRGNQVVVVAGETGSGKTTQLPKMCLEAGLGIEGKIGCTQPRRVAALSISRRLAEELGVDWGRQVGCKIRFEDRSSSQTYIKLMTDGILLAETQGDPLLTEYNAIIIDEAHERSLNIDFLLGHLKNLLARRADLKLIITSATIDTGTFSRAFDNAPVVEVSGRTYPVEVRYRPIDAGSEESGEVTFIDAAVAATEEVWMESASGDVLIFMPGERDIRETRDRLEGLGDGQLEVIPLFGRLSGGEQQRVFAPSSRRKIVVATNIAETSLTIPGIRYVIDSGLARISRYSARTRTKRLPVEPISQSSANQRKGRAGRVQDGICIRLYPEEDFMERPADTPPEILRANLAEVILRLKASRLGDIETFPFIQPPAPAAIQGGYTLLHELGALDEQRELTPLGCDLARLPIDPTLGRMLLQSESEHATRELLIIAAGLSIQDPRERPLDHREAADAAHRRFVSPRSDFLTLLNIWDAFHEEWETLRTQNQQRKFCKAHFLSYLRLREWQELHAQLHDALEELGTVRINESNAAYEAIHRSILAGLLGHVSCRSERNLYKAPGNRQVSIFPGSALFDRQDRPKKGEGAPSPSTHQPEWIVAGEMVETSQLFARTVAGIDPAWIVELGAHVCRVTHEHPHWSVAAGRVLAEERVTLYGLDVQRRKVAYGTLEPAAATAIFIRSALVEEDLLPAPSSARAPRAHEKPTTRDLLDMVEPEERPLPAAFQFLEHNRQVRHRIETWQTRVRHHDLPDLDEALFRFYSARLTNVSSIHELSRVLQSLPHAGHLHVTEADLVGTTSLHLNAGSFPDHVELGGQRLALSYAYAPGEPHDGVTLIVPHPVAAELSPASVAWAVPGLREEQAAELLRALPKAIRRELMPFPPKIETIVQDFHPQGRSLLHDLGRFVHQRFGVAVPDSAWPSDPLPAHLLPRVEIIGPGRNVLASGRRLERLRLELEKAAVRPPGESAGWKRATQTWERFDLRGWTVGSLPECVSVEEEQGQILQAWPGLTLEDGHVNLRLFPSRIAARRSSLAGIRRLVEIALEKDLAWLAKDLRGLNRFAVFGANDQLQADALEHLKHHLLPGEVFPTLDQAQFDAAVSQARARVPGLAASLIERVGVILHLRQDVLRRCGPAPTPAPARSRATLTDLSQLASVPAAVRPSNPVAAELEELVPPRFLLSIPFESLVHVPRYLKGLLLRTERAANNPAKDADRVRLLAPYVAAYRDLMTRKPPGAQTPPMLEALRWMLEEYKVSLFAQELGTAQPISPKRLEDHLLRLRELS